jgi:hypothetical protein
MSLQVFLVSDNAKLGERLQHAVDKLGPKPPGGGDGGHGSVNPGLGLPIVEVCLVKDFSQVPKDGLMVADLAASSILAVLGGLEPPRRFQALFSEEKQALAVEKAFPELCKGMHKVLLQPETDAGDKVYFNMIDKMATVQSMLTAGFM